jgi:hypothetical protein
MASNYPDFSPADRIQELYKRLSWVASAVDVVATIGSGTEKSVKRMTGEDEEDIINHDFEMLLLAPNPAQPGRSLIFALLADYKLHNKAYIWMNIVNGKPMELWRIPPTMIAPVTSDKLGIDHFLYSPGNGVTPMEVPIQEIVYLCGYDPYKLIDPDSAMSSILLVASNDLQMQKWSTNVYNGNGRLPGVLSFADMIADPQWDNIQDDISDAAQKQNLLLLRGTGTGAIQYLQTSSPPKDMEFYIGRNNNRDEIWSRLAPGLTSMLSESATEANSRSGKATLIDLVVYPLIQMFYETITQQIIWRYYGTDLKIEPDDIRVTDRVLLLAEISEFSKTATVNEVRTTKWMLDKLSDERGEMLVAEAQSYKTVKEPTPEPFNQAQDNAPELPAETQNAQTDIESQQEQVMTKEYKDPRPTLLELEKWERKAIKHIGKEYEFECYNTPADMVKSIKAELIGCANPAAVKAVFEQARADVGEPLQANTDIMLLADRLDKILEAAHE